ncbi:MAG: CARDB domain-containing protein, partial [Planctomycetota bacterium]
AILVCPAKRANSFNPNLQVLSIAGDFESFSDQILTGTNLNANISGDAQFTFHGSGFWNRTTLDVDGIHLETDSQIRADGFISALGPTAIAGELDLADAHLRIGTSLEVTETGSILVAGGRFSSATGEVAELENAGTILRSSGNNLATLDVRIHNTGTLVNESREWTLNIHPDHVAQENGETVLTGGTWIAGEDSQPPASSNPTARPALLKFHDVPQIDRLAASVGLFRNNSGIVVGGSDRLLANLEQIDETGSLTLGHRILRGIQSENFVNRGTLRLEENSQLSLLHGDFAQSVEGKLEVEIGGLESESRFGAIDIQDGQATLAGHFEVELVNSFGPPVAESYEVISHNSLAGQFDQVSGLQLNRVPLFELASTSTSTRLVALVNTTDLSAGSIVVPSDSQAGALATVEYTVENVGDIAAAGTWSDSLYLSLDNVLDTNDVLFARVEQNQTVADSYTQSVTAPLPAVPDDTYRFILVTDSRGEVPDKSRRNNQTASLATVAIAAESLQFGVQKNASLNDRATLVYRLDVPPGVDVELEVSAEAPSQIEFIADTGNSGQLRDIQIDFDGSSHPAKKVLIGAPGIWYLGVRGRPENSGQTTNFSITARQSVFGFDSVSPAAGSNLGRVTSVVQGSGFSPQTSVTLEDQNENERGGSVTFVDTNTLFVTFDLRGLGTGNYAVRVADGELL